MSAAPSPSARPPASPRDCVAFAWAAVSPSHYSPVFTDRLRPGLSEQLWLHYLTLLRIDTDHRTPKANARQQLHPAGIFKRVWRHAFSFLTRSGENQILSLFFFLWNHENVALKLLFLKKICCWQLGVGVYKVYVTFKKQVFINLLWTHFWSLQQGWLILFASKSHVHAMLDLKGCSSRTVSM